MGDRSKIEWTEATWNPIRGSRGDWTCVKVSSGCANCYAERINVRRGGPRYIKGNDEPRLDREILQQPLHWRRKRMIFVCSMTDLFLESVPDEWIFDIFKIMAHCPNHVFQVLTKRAERMADLVPNIRSADYCRSHLVDRLHHVWLGVSVEDQKRANERIPHLVRTPASVRFLSCEPLLGPIDLGAAHPCGYYCDPGADGGGYHDHPFLTPGIASPISWVIAGGESGPGCRSMELDWARSIRDQCSETGVAFFMKQLGGWPNKHGDPEGWPEDLRVRKWPE